MKTVSLALLNKKLHGFVYFITHFRLVYSDIIRLFGAHHCRLGIAHMLTHTA
jgi:hypothetical protein